jgi:hypothetical protein
VAEDFLSIGGTTIALRCSDPEVTWHWDAPSRRFLVPPTKADVEIEVRRGRTMALPEPPLFESGSVWRIFRRSEGYRIECSAAFFGETPLAVAEFDETFTRGTITLSQAAVDHHVNPLQYPMDEVLTSNLLSRGRGVEIHSCGLLDKDGKGRLFAGVSGAGKTTTSRLWADHAAAILSDDRIIIREEEGRFWIYGTPWHGEAEISLAKRAPLDGIYLITQAEENELREISPAAAVARLIQVAFPPFFDERCVEFTIGYLERLVTHVPTYELRFRKDAGAVAVVRGA